MPLLGAHQSIAGGYYKAVEIAASLACDVVQVFTKNNNQWRAKEITEDEAGLFRAKLKELKIKHPIAHNSYLINLASPDAELWKKSIDSFVMELLRADQLGIVYVVSHPGAHTTSSEEAGLQRIIDALDEIHSQTPNVKAKVLLENTAGQGSCLGCKFEQLAVVLNGVKERDRLGGVCFDTCHAFAAGYPLAGEAEYKATMKAFDKAVGLKRIKAFHLNDSKKGLGSRVDRHDHIGRGLLGLEPFRLLLSDRRFSKVPMYLETPKGEENGENLDAINLRTLRGLINGK